MVSSARAAFSIVAAYCRTMNRPTTGNSILRATRSRHFGNPGRTIVHNIAGWRSPCAYAHCRVAGPRRVSKSSSSRSASSRSAAAVGHKRRSTAAWVSTQRKMSVESMSGASRPSRSSTGTVLPPAGLVWRKWSPGNTARSR
jgi:hypothetical protein